MPNCENNDPSLQTHDKGINKEEHWRFKVNSDTKRDKISKKLVFFIQNALSFYPFMCYISVLTIADKCSFNPFE